MRLLALDPGNKESGYVVYDTDACLPLHWAKLTNAETLGVLDNATDCDALAIETIQSFGMAVGQTTFDTCIWGGRFLQRWLDTRGGDDAAQPIRVYRKDVKVHLCGTHRGKDTNILAALMNRYGGDRRSAVGIKAAPGPLYGFKADCWSALAVAIFVSETGQLWG